MAGDLVRIYERLLNVFENDSGSPESDYKSVYVYRDGKNKRRQVTLARGFTDDGGNLKKVVERYIAKGGTRASFFQSRLPKFGTGVLVDDKEFLRVLVQAGDEPAMHEAQDEIFEEVYLQPALRWAETNRFTKPLSVAVIVDSFLQSGGMLGWLMGKFTEHKPVDGGNEMKWILSYLRERLAWFERVKGALHNCTYRPKFFLAEAGKGNWALTPPLVANGVRVA